MNLTIVDHYSNILTELKQAWESVQSSGKLHIVLIQGENGMYKSGIVRHFLDSSHAAIIEGYGADIPEAYHPLRLAFESFMRLDQVQQQLTKSSDHVDTEWQIALTAWANILQTMNLARQPALEQLVRWQPPISKHNITVNDEESAPLRAVTFPGLFTIALGELSALLPTVFFLDNLDLVDTATLDALRFEILPALGNSSVLFITAFEPPSNFYESDLGDWINYIKELPQVRSLNLPLLDESRVEIILQDQLPNLSDATLKILADRVYQTTHGNLAQVQEIINWLKNLNAIPDDKTLSVPDYTSLVQQQFEQFTLIERQILKVGSVQGQNFCLEATITALGYSTEEITDILAQIEQKTGTMIRLDSTVVLQERQLHWYRFQPQRTQTWLYQQISEEEKRAHHQKTALALESIYGAETNLIAGLLAQQFEQGGMPERAAYFYAEVARQANEQGASQKAFDYAQRGLALLGKERELLVRSNLLLQKGRALLNSEQSHLAQEIFQQALELIKPISNPTLTMHLLYFQGEALLNRNVWDEGMEYVEKALELAIQQKVWSIVVNSMENLRSRYSKRDPQVFLNMCDRMITHICQDSSPAAKITIVEILEDKAWFYYHKQKYAEALSTLQSALDLISTGLINPSSEIYFKIHRLYSQTFRSLRDFPRSLQEAEYTLKWANTSYNRANIAQAHGVKGTLLRHMGRIDEGEQEYEAALVLLHNTSDIKVLADMENDYGEFLSRSGRKRRAKEFYERSYAHSQKINDLFGLQIAQNNLSAINKCLGIFQPVLGIYRQLYSDSIGQDDKSRQSISLNHIGDICRILNQLDEAELAHQQAIRLCEEFDNPSRMSTSLRYLARVHLCKWQLEQARSNLNASNVIAQDMKTAIPDQRFYGEIFLGRLELSESKLINAETWLKSALVELLHLQDQMWIGIGQLNLGLLFLAEGQPLEALSSAQSALTAFHISESWRAAEAHYLLARCYLALGNFEQAEEEIVQAITNFQDLGLFHRVFQAENTELHIQDAQQSGDWVLWQHLTLDELQTDFNHLGI